MRIKQIRDLIELKLNESGKKVRNRNAIEAFCGLFPPVSAIWKVLAGSQDALALEKSRITQETILDILVAFDNKLETGHTDEPTFKILLDGVVAYGDVSGLKASTSNPVVAQLFSKKDIDVVLKNVHARGNVIAVDLQVDQELELKKRLHIETASASVDLNAGPNCQITLGKGIKRNNDE